METLSHQRVRYLTAHPSERLLELTAQMAEGWDVSYKALPQTGLTLLQVRDSVLHEPYYLGEIPLSSAWVKIVTPDGLTCQGAAQVMSDVPYLAAALAICDAVLSHQLPGWQQVEALVEQGQAIRQQQDCLRGAMLAKTRVDFSRLSQEETNEPN